MNGVSYVYPSLPVFAKTAPELKIKEMPNQTDFKRLTKLKKKLLQNKTIVQTDLRSITEQ